MIIRRLCGFSVILRPAIPAASSSRYDIGRALRLAILESIAVSECMPDLGGALSTTDCTNRVKARQAVTTTRPAPSRFRS